MKLTNVLHRGFEKCNDGYKKAVDRISHSDTVQRTAKKVRESADEFIGSDDNLRQVVDKGKESARATGDFLKSVGSYTTEAISKLFKK